MKPIKTLLSIKKQTTKATGGRGATIELMLAEVNKERLGTKYKPLTPDVFEIRYMSLIPTEDLWAIHQKCLTHKDEGKYGWCLFGSLKPK